MAEEWGKRDQTGCRRWLKRGVKETKEGVGDD